MARATFAKKQFELVFPPKDKRGKNWVIFATILEDFCAAPRDLAKDKPSNDLSDAPSAHMSAAAQSLFNSLHLSDDSDDDLADSDAPPAKRGGGGERGTGSDSEEEEDSFHTSQGPASPTVDSRSSLSPNGGVLSGLTQVTTATAPDVASSSSSSAAPADTSQPESQSPQPGAKASKKAANIRPSKTGAKGGSAKSLD